MYFVDHPLWIGKSFLVELVAAPFRLRPVTPVLHDVIDGYTSFSVFSEGFHYFILCFVSFAALPEPHGPFGHDLRFSRKAPISADYIVHAAARHKIVIDAIAHLAPK
ncbi:hypothetical protein SDC9_183788 [bioreactor metagenome]|uniref:Uncharacterized protein n=1 Tax=bioreactor metagenome TaxID=1076179 RepID=A0A645HDS5_9ZZZZ